MRLNVNGSIFCTKNKKIDFEENKFNERFGDCSYLLHQNTRYNDESHVKNN